MYICEIENHLKQQNYVFLVHDLSDKCFKFILDKLKQ